MEPGAQEIQHSQPHKRKTSSGTPDYLYETIVFQIL